MNRKRILRIVGIIGIVLVLAVAGGIWLFFSGNAPDEVSLDAAIENAGASADEVDGTDTEGTTATTEVEQTTESTSTGNPAGIAGTWIIDTETGSFDFEAATGSFVGFRIEEELRSVGSTTAVGRTGDITGSMTIEGTTVVAAEFVVDLTTITTNSSRRDDNVQDALETNQFPTAIFELTSPIELGEGAATGEAVSVEATGNITIHGVTQSITFAMDAQLVDGSVIAVGSADMTFADFGVTVPQGGPVITVDDFGIVELQFLLNRS